MSLIKLTKNLENFQWTDYSKAGTGKSPQPDGTDYFERPNPKSLEQMETKFGKLDTQPTTRGPYGVSNVMDGTKQGRGFIKPGFTPGGFTKDMNLLHNKSEFVIGQDLTHTPLSYDVAGVTSNLFYGQVERKELNIEPQAEGAWGNTTLPISTYSSRQPIEDIPVGAIGGSNTYYGNLDLLSSRRSKFQKSDGSYTTPEEPLFSGGQRTFLIPAAYPDNTTAYSINNQFGWTHQSNYLESHGAAWRGFGLTTTAKGQMDESGYKDVTPSFYPSPPGQVVSQTPHPMNTIYLNSEPAYGAPSWLETQFLINYGATDGIWPYKVLSYFNPNTTGPHINDHHPIIRKDIGQRYPIGDGLSSWMALQVSRTADDINRIEGWLETPKGELWITQQNILQQLNPREETRDWNLSNLKLSIPPLFHATRHGGLFGGSNYMEEADFGPLYSEESKFGQGLLDMLDNFDSALGGVNFNKAHGRLNYLRDRFINGKGTGMDSFLSLGPVTLSNPFSNKPEKPSLTLNLGDLNLTNIRNSSPFGRPPKIPTQTTFSQRGAHGIGPIHTQGGKSSLGNPLHKYKALSYGQLGGKYDAHKSPLPSHGRKNEYDADEMVEGFMEMTEGLDVFNDSDTFDGLVADLKSNLVLFEQDKLEIGELDKAVKKYKEETIRMGKITNQIGDPGKQTGLSLVTDLGEENGAGLGIIKKNHGYTGSPGDAYKSVATDKINIHPYGNDLPDGVSDFIKFKFKDLVNGKFIVFRAILSGISDSISPEWSGTRYIGRPDQVYVYSGTERKISFSFQIYPKTKQEFPVLLEKLNYLIGLCYPTYTAQNRMIAPFIQLTLGDMFKDTPGFLDSLSIDVDDTGTWELADGLQFPKHITCQCSFTYIGKYLPSTLGKHYELPWLDDKGWTSDGKGTALTKGTFESDNENPTRGLPMEKLFSDLGAPNDAE